MRLPSSLLAGLALITPLLADPLPSFVPLPQQVKSLEGRFKIVESVAVAAPPALANEAAWLSARLRAGTGFKVPVKAGGGIVLSLDESLPEEGYLLVVEPAGVKIRGGSAAGVFYGAVTFLQTLPPEAFGSQANPKADWSTPCLAVKDAPATTWRGLHLDSSRHFQPKEWILKFLDAMAAQKLNRFHWHLIDSEAWRLEIRKYPKLVEVHRDFPAYYPEEIPTNPTFRAKYRYGHFHGGGHYSQEDAREIVAHAAKLHITVVPEIEFPGHAMAALTAYPEFSTTGKVPVVASNITPDLFGTDPKTMAFLKDVLDETMAIFPGQWIHFGGDEAPKGQWKDDAATQKRIDELGLRAANDPKHPHASEDALQAWMFNELAAHIAKNGRKAVGWEEIMHGKNIEKLAKGAVIMPWLSVSNGAAAANAGYGVVHTAVGPFYLDSYQVSDPREPSALYNGPMTAEGIHRFNLFPAGLKDEGRKNILGAQAQLWSELMPRTDDVEYQAFPRACALAELTWTEAARRADTNEFMSRLVRHGARLTAMGLNHRRVAPVASLTWSPEFLASGSDWLVAIPESVCHELAAGGKLRVEFQYGSGGSGLDMNAVEVLLDGKKLGEDRHKGFTGTSPRDAAYEIKIPAGEPARKLTLRIDARGAGGNDSHGTVTITPKR